MGEKNFPKNNLPNSYESISRVEPIINYVKGLKPSSGSYGPALTYLVSSAISVSVGQVALGILNLVLLPQTAGLINHKIEKTKDQLHESYFDKYINHYPDCCKTLPNNLYDLTDYIARNGVTDEVVGVVTEHPPLEDAVAHFCKKIKRDEELASRLRA